MTEQVVNYSINDSIAEIILDRPDHYNAFNSKLREELVQVIDKLEKLSGIRIVILRGAGPGFTSGADLNEGFPPPISRHLQIDYKPIFDRIIASKKLYMACVHGSAAGIGAALAMTCDLLIMGEKAKISVIFTNLGLIPDGGATWLLQQALGYRRTFQIIAEGGHISSQECFLNGLANKVVRESELLTETQKWAEELANRAPLAVSAAKRLLRLGIGQTQEQAFLSEAEEQDALSISEDFHNARKAFLAKEKVFFKGK